MNNRLEAIKQNLYESAIIPVVKINNPLQKAKKLSDVLFNGGLNVVEVTFRAEKAETAISIIKNAHPNMLVGAGTVFNMNQLDLAVEAGADFIVSPGFDPVLVEYAQKKDCIIFPGCSTPSDFQQSLRYGLDTVKFFPAKQLGGCDTIKALYGPFPMLDVIPTGGIALDNLSDYIKLKSVLACGATYIAKEEIIDSDRWDIILDLCKSTNQIVSSIRRGKANESNIK